MLQRKKASDRLAGVKSRPCLALVYSSPRKSTNGAGIYKNEWEKELQTGEQCTITYWIVVELACRSPCLSTATNVLLA